MPTPPIPQPLRAAAGLAAVAIDSARKLPEQLVGFPVLAVSAALQASLKAQQRYAELVVRGDQLLDQLRGPGDGTPSWARFDDDIPTGPSAGRPRSAFDLAADDPEVADLLGGGEDEAAALADAADIPDLADPTAATDLPDPTAATDLPDLTAAADLPETPETPEPTGAAELLAQAEELVEVDAPVVVVDDEAEAEAVAEALAADGYLATDPPIPGYDGLSLPQLRGRLRSLSVEQVEALIAYERQVQARAPFLTMLENRLATLRSR